MMKINNLPTSSIVAIILVLAPLFSFATECDSINDELTSKFRFLGNWNANGVPEYLELENDEVSDALIDYVNAALPESVKVPGNSDEFFGDDVQLNTELKEDSKVYLTMVHEGAAWTNTLGFYTYDVANPPQTVYDIDSLVIIFPNVSQTRVVQPGNKVLLGEFPAETGIGYFLIAKGWVGDTICLASHIVFTDTHLNTFTTPEYQQQTILLNYQPEDQILLCFEDIKRPGGDNDFNDAVFYVTAEPGAIDTTNIPVIPTAMLSGDTTLCNENDVAELNLQLTGKAPWAVTITNGVEEQLFEGIAEREFVIETILKDSIWIKSFSDSRKPGVKSGYALVDVSSPSASLNGESALCIDTDDRGGFTVQLEGIAPFSLTYTIAGEESTIEGLMENQYEISAEIGQQIKLISMADKYCAGEVSNESVEVHDLMMPSVVAENNGVFCEGEDGLNIQLSFSGKGPWMFDYLLNGKSFSVEAASANYELSIQEIGSMEITSVSDANCVTSLSRVINIQPKVLPTANILNSGFDCEDKTASVEIGFEGEGPWSLDYKFDDEQLTIESTETSIVLYFTENGLFELINIQDAFCENSLEDNQEILIPEAPTATISGDASICNGDEATVKINLAGVAPFEVIYTDGENEVSVTTEENLYEFTSTDLATYSLVSVTDANCQGKVEGSATISKGSDDFSAAIDAESNSCFGEDITLALSSDLDNLTVKWTADGEGTLSNTDQLITSYAPAENESGDVVFYAEVSNGCTEKIVGKTVTILDELTAVISGDASICDSEEATIQIALTGEAPFEVIYTDGENEFSVNTSEALYEFSSGELTTYTLVSVMNANCEGSVQGSATISKSSDDLNVEIDAEATSCFGEAISLALTGDTDKLDVKWTTEGAGTLSGTNQLNTSYTPAGNESGDVVFYAEVTNGCAIKTISKSVTIIEELTADFDISPANDLLTNMQITFTPDQSGYDEYVWDFGDETGSSASIASTEYNAGCVYNISLTVVQDGCEANSETQIEVLSKDELFIPNAFHPYAQNPENQVVKVYGNNIDDSNFFFKIINRWGKVMYETSSFTEANSVGWNGVNNNTDEELEMNVFTYIVRGRFIEGESFEKTGTITQVK